MTSDRPRTCPQCHAEAVVPIVYGLPGPELMEDAEAGRVALGGCMVSPDNPRWSCQACGWSGTSLEDGSAKRSGER